MTYHQLDRSIWSIQLGFALPIFHCATQFSKIVSENLLQVNSHTQTHSQVKTLLARKPLGFFFKFHNDQCPDCFDELCCPVGEKSVITHSSNKRLKVPLWKTKLGIQSLSYCVGPNTWNSLPGNLKSATSGNFLSIILRNISSKKYVTLKQTFIVTPKKNRETKFATF